MKLFPPTRPRSGIPLSEELIFDKLKDLSDCDDWFGIYSLKQNKTVENIQAETDFVILVPGKGIVLIEAKGSKRATLSGEEWTLEDVPPGAEHKSPLDQIDRARRNIGAHLRDVEIDPHTIPFARLVWLPRMSQSQFAHVGNTGMLIQPWELAFNGDLDDAKKTILRALDDEIATKSRNADNTYRPEDFSVQTASRIVDALVPKVSSSSSKRDVAVKLANEKIASLTNSAMDQVALIANNQHIFVVGPPGTAKTQMLGKLAVDAAKSGRKVLITCYNLMLADYFQIYYGGHPNIHVIDIEQLFLSTARLSKHRTNDLWFSHDLPKMAVRALQSGYPDAVYDLIVIDEFQDVAAMPHVVDAIFRYFNPDSPFDYRVILAADEFNDAQSLSESYSFSLAQELFGSITRVTPYVNCRQVPGLSQEIYKFFGMGGQVPEQRLPSELEWHFEIERYKASQQVKVLASVVRRLLESYDPAHIRILSPSGQNSLAYRLFHEVPNSADERYLRSQLRHESSSGHIRWRSIPKFKGLEQEVVVITDVDIETANRLAKRNLSLDSILFEGMTRARMHVVLMIGDELYSHSY